MFCWLNEQAVLGCCSHQDLPVSNILVGWLDGVQHFIHYTIICSLPGAVIIQGIYARPGPIKLKILGINFSAYAHACYVNKAEKV
jgi:hypothetical protein